MVVTWGLPWQAPAVCNASLYTFLVVCQRVTLEPLPSSHTHARTTVTTEGWPPLIPIHFVRDKLWVWNLCLDFPQSLLEGACIILQALIFYRSPWYPVMCLPLLVSTERRTRRHTGDVLLCSRVGLSFVLVVGIRRTMAPGISQDSSFFKHERK